MTRLHCAARVGARELGLRVQGWPCSRAWHSRRWCKAGCKMGKEQEVGGNSKTVCQPATPTRRRQAFSVTSATRLWRVLAPLSATARLARIFLGRSKQASARNRTTYCPDSGALLARATLTAAWIQRRRPRSSQSLVLAKVRLRVDSSTHAEAIPQSIIFTRSSRVVPPSLARMVTLAR